MRKVEALESPEKSIIDETFGIWKKWKISSEEFVRKIRKESEKRLERLSL